jgi:hypothetical protein
MPFFCYMWEYLVRPDRLDDFMAAYGPCRAFRERYRQKLEALDERCEALTIRETHLGDFELVG